MQPGLRVSVTFPNHWEPLESEANQINRITIPEVQYIKFLGIYWSNPTIRHTLVFTTGSHETCLDLLGYGESHSNPQCSSTVGTRICWIFFVVVTLLSSHKEIELFLQKAHSPLVKLYPWLKLLGVHMHVMRKERTWRTLKDLLFNVSTVILKFCSVRRSRGISVRQSCGEVHSITWRGHDWECSWLRAECRLLRMEQDGMNIFCSPSCWKIPHQECEIWMWR